MAEKFEMEWSYTPVDFFEEAFEYSEDNYTVKINDGRVVATIFGASADQSESLRARIEPEVSARFLAAQLFSNKPYQLSGFTTKLHRSDGTAEIGVLLEDTVHLSDHVDVVVRDAAGNIKSDTRRDRIEERKEFARLASGHRTDPLVVSLFKSYNAAIGDPQNELTHLYEIRDALTKKFGDEGSARSALNIPKDQWSRLGYLANEAPLSQGRHRGRKIGQLRDASSAELDEARRIAKRMVRAYLDHLERLIRHRTP